MCVYTYTDPVSSKKMYSYLGWGLTLTLSKYKSYGRSHSAGEAFSVEHCIQLESGICLEVTLSWIGCNQLESRIRLERLIQLDMCRPMGSQKVCDRN